MKRFYTIIILSLTTLSIFAQSMLPVITNEKVIGKNDLTNSDIYAKEFVFSERIDNSYVDTTSNLLTVQLRGITKNGKYLKNTGDVILYDLSAGKIVWTKKINYQQSSFQQFDNVIIQTIANKSYCLNMGNGEYTWEVKNTIYYVDPFLRTGIGYKFKNTTGYTNTLEGINLANGKSIWKREINREYSWNDIFHLNDSVIIVAAAGLHSINLKNGKGWDYNTITGKKDYTATIASNAAGVALGILTGTFVTSTGHNLVRDVVSNVLTDSLNIWFASKEKITCLNHDGQVIWSNPLPEDLVSKSSIFINDSLLCMVNYGYAFMGYRQLDFGTPFIAAFNKNTGKQVFLSPVSSKKDQINGYTHKDNTLFLVFKDRIAKYSMVTATKLLERSVTIDSTGELMYFIGNQVYLKSDSTYHSLLKSDSADLFLYTKSGKTLIINDNLEATSQIGFDQLYLYYLKKEGYKFLSNKNITTVINQKNKKIADLQVSGNSFLIGSKLYDMQKKSFFEVDIDELIKK